MKRYENIGSIVVNTRTGRRVADFGTLRSAEEAAVRANRFTARDRQARAEGWL